MFQSTDDRERDNTYSKRENGYYPPFEERDRETHFRRENTSYYNERRERDDRERDYGYRQKRDWDLPRDYRPHDLPSPKRRKVGHEGYYENRNFSYNRGMSRSPSPPKLDKERYGREYYDSREPFPKNYSYGERERESEHRFYREPNYSRGPRNVPWDRNAPSTNMNSSNYKYEYGRYYDNGGYRKDSNYEDYNRSRPRVYQRDYDRERYNDRGDYFEKRDPYMRERYDYSKDDARERGEYFRDSRDKYYSPRSPTRDGREVYSPRDRDYSPRDKKEEQEEGQITGTDTSTSAPAPTPQEQQPVEKPQPRRTLGWGQGLMSTIKKVEDQKKDEDSAKSSPALGPVPESKAETSPTDEPKTEQMSEQKSNEVSFPVSEDSNMVEDKMEVEQKEAEREEEQGPVYEFPSLPSKEEVLLSIERLDAEITKTEILIHNLNKPKKPEHRHHKSVHSIREQIYEDNKEKVQQAEEELAKFLSPCLNGTTKPLYKQPQDLDFYQQNIDKNAQIRSQVMKVVFNRRVEAKEKKTALTEEFSKLHSKWKKKVKFMEAQRKKKEVKAQEEPLHIPRRATNLRAQVVRQAFPSTPTTPTGRRGFGDAIRSEAEFEEILYQLKEEDERDMSLKYLGTLAKIPPMILDKHKYPPYVDKNGLVEDPMAAERERKMLNPWTEEEKQIFIRKFTQYPKNFTKISSFLDNKTTNEVIWFYYANKKTLDLKKILLEQQTKRKGLARKNAVSTPTNSNVPRELANLGAPWMSETGRIQRSSVRGVNYAESREEIVVEKEMKPVNNRLPLVDPDCRWNEREKETFIAGLTKYGKDFRAISALMGSKTEFQCQNFYHNNKRKLNFDDILERCGMAKDKRRKSVPQTTTKEDLEKERRTREERRVENTWTEQEKAEFVKCLSEFGKNWRKIAQNIPTKSQNQIKYYFQVSKDKLNLDQYLDPEERGDIAKKRGRKKSEDKGPRKLQKLEKDDSDSSAVLSPMPGESPFVDERSNSPFIESTVGSAILSGSLKEDQDVKAVEITQIEEVKERIAKVNEAITSATKIESQEEIDIGNSEVPIENPIPMEISKIDQANEFQTEMVEAVSQEAETKDVAFEESLVPHRTIVEDENLEPMIQQKVIEHNEALENTPQTEESRTIEVPPQELAIPLEENRLKVEKADSIQQEPVPSPINPSEMTANQDLDQTVVNNDTTLETIPQVNHPSDLVEQTNLLQNDERLKTEAKNTEDKLVETGQQPSEMEANVAETEDKIERTEEMIEKTAEKPPVEETPIEKEEEIEERSMEPQGIAELDEQLEKNEEQPPRAIEEQLFEESTEQRLPDTSEDVASYNNFQTSIPYEESTTDIASNVKPEETIEDQEEAPITTLEEVNSNEQPKEEYGESEPVQYEETYYQEQHQEVAEEYVAENQEPQEYYGVQLATLEDGEISEGYAPNAEQEETVKTSNEASGENIEVHYELPSEDMGASEGTAIVFDPEQVSAFKALESEQFWGTSTDSNQGWQGEENMDIEPS